MSTILASARRHLLKRIEFYVLGMALAFVGVTGALVWADASAVVSIITTVLGMGAIQTAVQWANRQREKSLRARAIFEIREMLRDQVLNQLAAMKMCVSEDPDPGMIEILFAEVDGAIDEIAGLVDRLTEEQLNTWKLTYANAADHVAYVRAAMA